jgi:hypothetical protein
MVANESVRSKELWTPPRIGSVDDLAVRSRPKRSVLELQLYRANETSAALDSFQHNQITCFSRTRDIERTHMSDFETDMETIRDYVSAIVETKSKIATAYLAAIDNCQTTLQSASKAEAKPDILGAVMKSGLKAAEKTAQSAVKAATGTDFGPIADMIHGMYDEIDRAAKAAKNFAVSEWIKGIRSSVTNAYTRDQTGTALRKQVEDEYNQNNEGSRGGYIGGIQIALHALQSMQAPRSEELEVAMYQAWINKNFEGDCIDGSGIISIQFDEDGKFTSATVVAPQGDKIAGAFNNVMGNANVNQLMDLEVVKRVCKGDHCVCFDGNNVVRKDTEDAQTSLFLTSHDTWQMVTQFD